MMRKAFYIAIACFFHATSLISKLVLFATLFTSKCTINTIQMRKRFLLFVFCFCQRLWVLTLLPFYAISAGNQLSTWYMMEHMRNVNALIGQRNTFTRIINDCKVNSLHKTTLAATASSTLSLCVCVCDVSCTNDSSLPVMGLKLVRCFGIA